MTERLTNQYRQESTRSERSVCRKEIDKPQHIMPSQKGKIKTVPLLRSQGTSDCAIPTNINVLRAWISPYIIPKPFVQPKNIVAHPCTEEPCCPFNKNGHSQAGTSTNMADRLEGNGEVNSR
jgi:hypothetical protein